MIAELLTCALSLQTFGFNGHSKIEAVRWVMKTEEERLRGWIHKNNPDCEIFIHPNPQEDKLKENGWEKVPFTWRGNQIWIHRKPKSDQKELKQSA